MPTACERFGVEDAAPFYAARVIADELHQHVALDEMVGGLVEDEPALADDVVFGARALDVVERHLSLQLLGAWSRGELSLLPAPCAVVTMRPGSAHDVR